MKRLLIIFLTLTMLLLTACGNEKNTSSDNIKPPVQSEQQKDESSKPDESLDSTDNSSDEQTSEQTETDKQDDAVASDSDKPCDHVFLAPTCNYPETCAKCKVTREVRQTDMYILPPPVQKLQNAKAVEICRASL